MTKPKPVHPQGLPNALALLDTIVGAPKAAAHLEAVLGHEQVPKAKDVHEIDGAVLDRVDRCAAYMIECLEIVLIQVREKERQGELPLSTEEAASPLSKPPAKAPASPSEVGTFASASEPPEGRGLTEREIEQLQRRLRGQDKEKQRTKKSAKSGTGKGVKKRKSPRRSGTIHRHR